MKEAFKMSRKEDSIRTVVRNSYGEVARSSKSGCGCDCGCDGKKEINAKDIKEMSKRIGYLENDLKVAPAESNMGLGCGNPTAIASLRHGEIVLDLGSGGGFDCFLAREKVGEEGYVIGVDMTPDMISLARKNADDESFENIEFRLGEIENLPIADGSIDIIISNCVINLSPNKPRVYEEAYRVLKSGGRVCLADIATTAELPETIQNDLSLYVGCVSGASTIGHVKSMLEEAGFRDVRITPKDSSKELIDTWSDDRSLSEYIVSVIIEAVNQ